MFLLSLRERWIVICVLGVNINGSFIVNDEVRSLIKMGWLGVNVDSGSSEEGYGGGRG